MIMIVIPVAAFFALPVSIWFHVHRRRRRMTNRAPFQIQQQTADPPPFFIMHNPAEEYKASNPRHDSRSAPGSFVCMTSVHIRVYKLVFRWLAQQASRLSGDIGASDLSSIKHRWVECPLVSDITVRSLMPPRDVIMRCHQGWCPGVVLILRITQSKCATNYKRYRMAKHNEYDNADYAPPPLLLHRA